MPTIGTRAHVEHVSKPSLRAVPDSEHRTCPECGAVFHRALVREVRVVNALAVVAIVMTTFLLATLLWLAVAYMFLGAFFSGGAVD